MGAYWRALALLLAICALVRAQPTWASRAVTLGVYRPGAPDTEVVRAFDQMVGKRAGIVHWYQSWGNTPLFPSAAASALIEDGRTPLITWEPWDWRTGADQAPYQLQ